MCTYARMCQTPAKALGVQTSNLAGLITSQGKCHKRIRDVTMTSYSKIICLKFAFLYRENRFFAQTKASPKLTDFKCGFLLSL